MPAPTEPNVSEIVARYVAEDGGAIVKAGLDSEISQASLDAAQDLTGALQDLLAAGNQLEADLADFQRRRDLTPPDGYNRLVADAQRDAQDKATTAQHAAERAYEALDAALFEDALPKFAPEREQLARDEAHLALSNGQPEHVAMRLADRGNDEALAALLSPWGRTLLEARGVHNVDATLSDIRKIVRGRVIERADTPAARLLRDHMSGLGAAKGSAGSKVRDLGGRW